MTHKPDFLMNPPEPQHVPIYEPPRIKVVLTPEALEREVMSVAVSRPPIP